MLKIIFGSLSGIIAFAILIIIPIVIMAIAFYIIKRLENKQKPEHMEFRMKHENKE